MTTLFLLLATIYTGIQSARIITQGGRHNA